MELAQGITLIAATISMGLAAGLFYTFAHDIMPGLRRCEDSTFVAAFQAIDKAINNPWQAIAFVGAAVFTASAVALHLGADDRSSLGWIAAALVLYGVVLAITFRVNLPLNNQIQAAGTPDRIANPAAVRARFEARWVRWNIARAALSTTAFGCLTWTLVLFGDSEPQATGSHSGQIWCASARDGSHGLVHAIVSASRVDDRRAAPFPSLAPSESEVAACQRW